MPAETMLLGPSYVALALNLKKPKTPTFNATKKKTPIQLAVPDSRNHIPSMCRI